MPFCQNRGCDTPPTSRLYEWEVWVILEILLCNCVAKSPLHPKRAPNDKPRSGGIIMFFRHYLQSAFGDGQECPSYDCFFL
jgi:hypothetical protein